MLTYPYFIVSAERTERSRDQNTLCMMLAERMAMAAPGVTYSMVSGAYNGAAEHSLALFGPNAEATAQAIAKVFSQETYLDVQGYSSARLWTPDGQIVAVFTQRIAATADNYTQIGDEVFSFAA